MKTQTQRNQGRQPIGFYDSPLFHFFLKHFCKFSADWPCKRDITKIGVVFDEDEKMPAYGYPTLMQVCDVAANPPGKIKPRDRDLYRACLLNSPEFTVDLIRYARKQFKKCKPEKRAILFQNQKDNGKFSNPEKTERHALRVLINQQNKSRKAAYTRLLKTSERILGKKS